MHLPSILLCAVVSALSGVPTVVADIWSAIKADSPTLIEKELAQNPQLLNTRGPGGQTPLMHYVLSGKIEALKLFISKGADATIGEKDGYTPMHGAGFQGRAEMVPLLAEYGLDPNEMHSDGYTPIHRACWGREQRHANTVKAFIEAGVDPRQRTRDGRGPLSLTQNAATKKVIRSAIEKAEL